MPRRETPDAEDLMPSCPHCLGEGQVWSTQIQHHVECPVCLGHGRVSQAQALTYQSGARL